VNSIFNDKEFQEKVKFYEEISPIQERKMLPAPRQDYLQLENEKNSQEKSLVEVQTTNKRPMKSMNTKLAELNKRIINDVVFDQMKTRAIKAVLSFFSAKRYFP
jgi:hypothetical protein